MKIRPNNPFRIATFAFLLFFALFSGGPYCGLPEDVDELMAKEKAIKDAIKRVKISMLDERWIMALEDLNILINQ